MGGPLVTVNQKAPYGISKSDIERCGQYLCIAVRCHQVALGQFVY